MVLARYVCLKSFLGKNEKPQPDNFELKESEQSFDLKDGEVLVKTLGLSMDPILRKSMSEGSGLMTQWKPGEPCTGVGVGVVVQSKFPGISQGFLVESRVFVYQTIFVINGEHLNTFYNGNDVFKKRPFLALSVCGLTGLTAYYGIRERCHIELGKNQTVVVSGAAGGVGYIAGQIAKIKGATNVIGICGTDAKCKMIVDELGFNGAINYKTDDIPAALRRLCPNGVDCYFDNVGGQISEHVARVMAKNSFIAVCGSVSAYNSDSAHVSDSANEIDAILKERNVTKEGFYVWGYRAEYPAAVAEIANWYQDGKIKVKETIAEGIENVGHAFVSMMTGGNIGKQIVRVSSDPV